MNGTHTWEYKQGERQDRALNGETAADPAAENLTTIKRTTAENTGRFGWRGAGTLWIADPELPLRKR